MEAEPGDAAGIHTCRRTSRSSQENSECFAVGWFVTWLDAYFPEETHATELPQRRPVARSVTLHVHSALNAVFQALDLPGMSTTEIEAAVEHRIRLAGPRTGVSDEELVQHVIEQRGLKVMLVQPETAQGAHVLLAQQGRRWTAFVQADQEWWRVEKALLVRVRSLQAALRAALGPRGKLLQLSPGDGQSASQGLLLQLANAGRGSVALVPYSQPLHGHLASSGMETVSGDCHEAQEPALSPSL